MPGHEDAGDPARYRSEDAADGRSATGRPRIDVIPIEAPETILARLSARFTVRIVEPSSAPSHARCLLAVALALDRADVRARLQQIRRQHPASPLVIITSGDAANLERLLGLNADGVVTVERIEDELGSVVHSLQHRSPLEVAATAFEEAESLDDVVRAAVVTALRSVPPIHTVKALARQAGLSRKRLWDRFRPLRLRTGWSCLDLLHAVALWRTIELVRSGGNIRRAWRDLGLSPRTARRACRAHLGCSPSDLLDRADTLERAILDFVERCLTEGVDGQIDRVGKHTAGCRAVWRGPYFL